MHGYVVPSRNATQGLMFVVPFEVSSRYPCRPDLPACHFGATALPRYYCVHDRIESSEC